MRSSGRHTPGGRVGYAVDIDVLSACIVYANERIPPKSEVCIALAGPLFNLLGALAGSLLLLGVRSTPCCCSWQRTCFSRSSI